MAPKSCFFLHCFNNYFSRLFNSKYGSKWPGTNCCTGFWWILNSTLTDSFKNEKSIRFTLSPEENRIDFSDFSPWGWGIKSEKLVFLLMAIRTNSATISVR
jgi:hypothetical protein